MKETNDYNEQEINIFFPDFQSESQTHQYISSFKTNSDTDRMDIMERKEGKIDNRWRKPQKKKENNEYRKENNEYRKKN